MKKTKILLVGALLFGVPSVALSLSTQQENATVVRAATTNNYKWVSASEDAQIFGSNTNGTATLNGLDWEFTREKANFCNYTSSTLQFGKNGGSDGAITLVNKNTKNIKYIKVECASYNATSNIKISIGEEIYLNSSKTAKWSNNKTGVVGGTVLSTPISGDVKIEFTASNRALYLKSIELQYEEDQNAKKYTITYDANNGECSKNSDIYIEGNAGITLPDAKREGYTFDGWYDEDNNKVTSPYTPEKDITLHAKWTLNVNVIFKMNDGTDDNFVISTIKQGSKVEIPSTEPSRNGYSFTNWYTSADLSKEYNFDLIVNENLTLYAGWKEYEASTFTKVTSSLTDWTGKYLIVYEDGADAYVFNGIDGYINGKIENDKIQSTSEIEKNICTISKFNNGYSINIKNKYLSGTNNKNSLNLSQTEQLNNISFENNSIKIESNTSILRFNDTQDIMQFKYYKSSTYTYQEAIQLYKLEEKQEEQPTIDETTLTSYTSTLSIDNSKAIRFIGSVKETEFNNISKIGFNFTLKMENDNPISKEYSSDVNKLYKTINDSNVGIFDNDDAIYENNGFLNFSLILKNIPTNIAATIEFYSYAVINGKTYHSLTKDVVIMNGEIA